MKITTKNSPPNQNYNLSPKNITSDQNNPKNSNLALKNTNNQSSGSQKDLQKKIDAFPSERDLMRSDNWRVAQNVKMFSEVNSDLETNKQELKDELNSDHEIINLKEENNDKNIYFKKVFNRGYNTNENIYENYTKESQDKPLTDSKKNIVKVNEALWEAAEKGQLEKIKSLLDDKKQISAAQVNSKCVGDFTALHLAVEGNHFQVCTFLLLKQANVDAKTTLLKTPLHLACLKGNFQIVKLLVDSGANINAQDKNFNTPLHFVAEHSRLEILQYLLKKNADCYIKNNIGLTPIDMAISCHTRKIFETFGKSNNNLLNIFTRESIDGLTLFTSRSDMINKLLYSLNKSYKLAVPIKSLQGKNEYKVFGKLTKPKFNNLITKSFNTSFGPTRTTRNPTCIYFDEKIGPQSFNCLYMLGKGSYGEVYLVEKISNKKLYAMKILKKELVVKQNLTRYAKTERNILSLMNHPFIVRLNFAFQTDTKLYLLLDYCPGGDLSSLITKKRKLKEDVAKIYAAEIVLALEELHKNHIIFRDLKPDNVVIDAEGHSLLTDFGLSKEGADATLSDSFCGSMAYLAPEILRRAGHNKTVDWYLYGVLIYEMVVGVPPYFDPDEVKLFQNIERGDLKIPKTFSPELRKLILELLRRDPDKRLGSKYDADDIKCHPWFQGIDWNDVYNRKLKPPPPEIRDFNIPLINPKIQDSLPAKKQTEDHICDWSFVFSEEKS